MIVLALDTATSVGGVALLSDQQLINRRLLQVQRGHVANLPLVVHALLSESGLEMRQVNLLVVNLGPGSFTGVRIALSFAKGIHLASAIPMVGVNTLACMAMFDRDFGGHVLALLDAGRNEYYVGQYGVRKMHMPQPFFPEVLCTQQEVMECIHHLMTDCDQGDDGDGRAIVGASAQIFGQNYCTQTGNIATIVTCSHPDPWHVGLLGIDNFKRYGACNAATVHPIYLRQSEAERLAMAK